MAQLTLRIGDPIRIVSTKNGLIIVDKAYYLGSGCFINDFLPETISNPDMHVHRVKDYGDRVYPLSYIKDIPNPSYSHCTSLERWRNRLEEIRNCVGELLSNSDLRVDNIKDYDDIDTCHLNDFPWFARVKHLVKKIR